MVADDKGLQTLLYVDRTTEKILIEYRKKKKMPKVHVGRIFFKSHVGRSYYVIFNQACINSSLTAWRAPLNNVILHIKPSIMFLKHT